MSGTKKTRRKREGKHGLTPRERLFCEAYAGEAQGVGKVAAQMAGCKGSDLTLRVASSKMLANPLVQAELERMRIAITTKAVATREERQAFLTKMMRGEVPGEPKDRLKACEVLGKMQGDFRERIEVEHKGKVTVEHDYAMLSDEERANLRRLLTKAAHGG